jgi:hypothetical protein
MQSIETRGQIPAQGDVDRVRNHFLGQAILLCSKHNLHGRLGLNLEIEKTMFSRDLAVRYMRADYYDSSFLLSHPAAIVMARIPGLRGLVIDLDRASRAAEQSLLEQQGKMQAAFLDENGRMRARILELAANDLVARATTTVKNGAVTKINIVPEMLDDWEAKWKPELDQVPHTELGNGSSNSGTTKLSIAEQFLRAR